MSGRKLRFHDGDGYGPDERARLIAVIARNPFQVVAPFRWRCQPPASDLYEVRDTGGQYVVQQLPFLGHPITLARIGNVDHKDDGWIKAVGVVVEHVKVGGKQVLVVGKGQWR